MGSFRLSSNQSRLLYDFVALVASAALSLLFVTSFTGVFEPFLLLAPALGLACNYLVGVYGRHRLSDGPTKMAILSLSIGGSCLLLALAGVKPVTALLWAALAWGPLVLPRVFLNINRQPRVASTLVRSISDSLQERGPVLVVGGAGYIGTYVVDQLLREGARVRVLDRLFYGREPIQEWQSHPQFELIEGDVTDIGKLVRAVSGASAVIHLAGLVGDPACAVDEGTTAHCNVIATRMLKEVAQSYGIHRFIFASSCSGDGASDAVVDESSSLNPVSLYARTKIESEHELLRHVPDDFFVTVLRFATVFGHSRRPRFDLVANLFTAQAFHDGRITVHGGNQWRPFVHVRDLGRAIVLTLRAKPRTIQGQVFNVGDESLTVTIGDLGKRIQQLASAVRPIDLQIFDQAKDMRNYRVSFRKIRDQLGFQASVSLEDGVREMLEHMRAGHYAHYATRQYSNLEVTKEVVRAFHDPLQSSQLYQPLRVNSAGGIVERAA